MRVRFAVLRALFNADVTAALLAGALRGFADGRVRRSDIDVYDVPGAFELPIAASWLAQTKRYDAVVCLGCVIRGETPHFDYVADAAARGIADVGLATGVPIIFGVLTTENAAQAWARAGGQRRGLTPHTGRGAQGNKGYEAAQGAMAMAALRRMVAKPALRRSVAKRSRR
ncbi:MAG: 6,7-dimethyl-8-ribityllumazine synthase [Candidatus Eremiobacteraeota bacterium]|nr:6,7-dimethyl-8-ribityllumazine synthase [Candidatus Eremiobacteraeota bacterium]MBV8340544.1 6,7-dimethyl-8-ribityllumazine synthase [Candidatus Eremiobacteraeota bacterium]